MLCQDAGNLVDHPFDHRIVRQLGHGSLLERFDPSSELIACEAVDLCPSATSQPIYDVSASHKFPPHVCCSAKNDCCGPLFCMAEERGRAMRIPKDRNDRVMLVTMSGLVGLGLAVGLSLMPPVQLQATDDASAAISEFMTPKSYTAIPPSRPVALAHTTHKIVRSESPISVVRDP